MNGKRGKKYFILWMFLVAQVAYLFISSPCQQVSALHDTLSVEDISEWDPYPMYDIYVNTTMSTVDDWEAGQSYLVNLSFTIVSWYHPGWTQLRILDVSLYTNWATEDHWNVNLDIPSGSTTPYTHQFTSDYPGGYPDIDLDVEVWYSFWTGIAWYGQYQFPNIHLDVKALMPLAVNHSSDITYECNTTGHNLSWNITGTTGTTHTYAIYRNGTELTNQTWTSGTPVGVNIDGLAPEVYNYTIVAEDGLGNVTEDQVNVTVINSAPVISPLPPNVEYDIATAGNNITWNITDPSVYNPTYTVYRNESSQGTLSWTSGTPVVYDIDGLTAGWYNYTIVAADGLGNQTEDEVIVTVWNFAPVISSPEDIIYELSTTNNNITWTITDTSFSGQTYVVYKDEVEQTNLTWSSGTPVVFDIDGLAVGAYNYTIVAADGLGALAEDQVNVTVQNFGPIFSPQPPDVNYEVGTINHNITWTILDGSVSSPTYAVYQNETWQTNQTWAPGTPVVFDINGLSPKSYNYTIVASDGLGNCTNNSVIVTVDNTVPMISSTPLNLLTYEVNTTTHAITWTITDPSSNNPTFAIYRDGEELDNRTWASGTPNVINVDALHINTYNYTIVAVDGYGARVEDQVNVTVENLPPVIPAITAFPYEFSTTGHTIAWNITDASVYGPTYIVYRNGTEVANDAWAPGVFVVVNIDGRAIGLWNFTIVASDGLDNVTRNTVWVTVQNVLPTISPHADVTFAAGTPGQSLSWTVTDASVSGGTYAIYRTGELLTNQTWVSGTPITVDLSELAPGSYVYGIVVSDGLGGTRTDELYVTVTAAGGFPTEWVIIAVAGTAVVIAITLVIRKRRGKARQPGELKHQMPQY